MLFKNVREILHIIIDNISQSDPVFFPIESLKLNQITSYRQVMESVWWQFETRI
jgi:hypothetical protein